MLCALESPMSGDMGDCCMLVSRLSCWLSCPQRLPRSGGDGVICNIKSYMRAQLQSISGDALPAHMQSHLASFYKIYFMTSLQGQNRATEVADEGGTCGGVWASGKKWLKWPCRSRSEVGVLGNRCSGVSGHSDTSEPALSKSSNRWPRFCSCTLCTATKHPLSRQASTGHFVKPHPARHHEKKSLAEHNMTGKSVVHQ